MAQFEVSTSKLAEEAAALKTLKGQLEQEIMAMRSISARFLSGWAGESHEAFKTSVDQNMALLSQFSNTIQKFAEVLTQGGSTYEAAENEAKRIASQKGQ